MPVVELVNFLASEALLANNDLTAEPMKAFGKVEGCLSVHFGPQVEDKKTAYMMVAWETLEHHIAFTKSAVYPELMKALGPAVGGPLDVKHVHYNEDTTNALQAAVTEITTVKLKEGKSFEGDLKPIIDVISEKAPLAKGGNPPVAFGEYVETPGVYSMLIGWDSLEAHGEVVKQEPFAKLIPNLFATGDLTICHVVFKKLQF
ncbi:hypothetical protein B0H34DRAFT_440813 [Crassisporium funariophilum]|nr:hypothetical protein B0H34DRAFT_440813 [Crassisporium funariophilum]